MRSKLGSQFQEPVRGGFTLLEVLLASLLATVVLVTLWSLSDIYLKLFVSGKRKIEETQLVRGLTQQFSKDISQVIQLPGDDSRQTQSHWLSPNGIGSNSRNGPPPPGMTRSNSNARPENRQTPAPASRSPEVAPPGSMGESAPAAAGRTTSSTAVQDTASSVRQSDRSIAKFGLFGTKQALRLIILQTDPRTAARANGPGRDPATTRTDPSFDRLRIADGRIHVHPFAWRSRG